MNKIYLKNDQLILSPGFPEEIRLSVLSGGEVWHISKEWGNIILQQIAEFGYNISLNYFHLKQSLEFTNRPGDAGLRTTIALKNIIDQTICGRGKFKLKENHFASAFGQVMERRLKLKKEKEYVFLDLFWSCELLERLLPSENHFRTLLRDNIQTIPVLVGTPYRITSPALQELIYSLLDKPYVADMQKESVSSLMYEILDNILLISSDQNFLSVPISEIEIRKIDKAKEFILNNISQHYTSDVIARKVGLSRTSLIQRFRQLTGKSLLEFLLYHRCASICDDLIHTDIPYKVLAQKSGYSDVPNFINGFKKHMGCSPAFLRKQYHEK
jgi:AraC-like DNA-binding protein